MRSQLELVSDLIDEAFRGPAWHGPSFLASIRGVKAKDAVKRVDGRHNVWEIVLHCAYWKHVAAERVRGVRAPWEEGWKNFPVIDSGDDRAWKAAVRLCSTTHDELRKAVAELSERELHEATSLDKRPRVAHITGAASHDVYHAGQIRYIRAVLGV